MNHAHRLADPNPDFALELNLSQLAVDAPRVTTRPSGVGTVIVPCHFAMEPGPADQWNRRRFTVARDAIVVAKGSKG